MDNIQKINTPYGEIMARKIEYYDNGKVKAAENPAQMLEEL